jgi:hypothetical protein
LIAADGRLPVGVARFDVRFLSAQKARELVIQVDAAGTLSEDSSEWPRSDGLVPMPSSWVDSPEVMKVAEASCGCSFRGNHPGAFVGAGMSADWPSYSGKPISFVTYLSPEYTAEKGGAKLSVIVDAVSGERIGVSN